MAESARHEASFIAHRLAARVSARPELPERAALSERTVAAAYLPKVVGSRDPYAAMLVTTAATRPDAEHRRGLEALVTSPAFVALPAWLKRRVLAIASAPMADARTYDELARVLAAPGFHGLSTTTRQELVAALAATSGRAEVRAAIVALLEAPAFATLGEPARAFLLRFAVGPRRGRFSPASHQATLDAWWGSRRAEIEAMIAAVTSGGASLLAFLHEPVRPFVALTTRARPGTMILVFGDPSDSRSLSYTRAIYRRDNALWAVVQSPNREVKNGWSETVDPHGAEWEAKIAMLSRVEELELLAWIEATHVISVDAVHRPPTQHPSMWKNGFELDKVLWRIVGTITAHRGGLLRRNARLVRGRVVAEAA